MVLAVVEPGRVFLGEDEVAPGDLTVRLTAEGISRHERIQLRVDGSVTYAAVMRIMGSLAAAGFAFVELIDVNSGLTD